MENLTERNWPWLQYIMIEMIHTKRSRKLHVHWDIVVFGKISHETFPAVNHWPND